MERTPTDMDSVHLSYETANGSLLPYGHDHDEKPFDPWTDELVQAALNGYRGFDYQAYCMEHDINRSDMEKGTSNQSSGALTITRLTNDATTEPVDTVLGTSVARSSHYFTPVFDFDGELAGSELTSQMEALYYLLKGDNVVLCGQAGAGKSWVIDTFKEIVDHCNARMDDEDRSFQVSTTASTGVAAALIKGKTIHSWSGLGIMVDKFDPRRLEGKNKKFWEMARKRIKQTDCLIIDEVSMLPAYFLSNLDRSLRVARNEPHKPFGGIQMILVGDFLQLPPVDKKELDSDNEPIDAGYCFRAKNPQGKAIFGASDFKWCYLDKVRRSDDDRLTNLLNDIRNECVTQEDLDNLKSRFGVHRDPGRAYTQLKTINRSVDNYNNNKLEELKGDKETYYVHKYGDEEVADDIVKRCRLSNVSLKPGAVVMLTSNQAIPEDDGKVNGSMGIVMKCTSEYANIRFNDGAEYDVHRVRENVRKIVVREVWDEELQKNVPQEFEEEVAAVTYMPVKLAWAITVHKSQGQTLDGAVINLSTCFQRGLGYVALSRCRSLDDIIMEGDFEDLPIDALLVNEEAIDADRKIKRKAKKDRESLLENEARVRDLESALRVASSKAAVNRITKQMDENPSVMGILKDDESCFDWVHDHRARKHRKKKAYDEWTNPNMYRPMALSGTEAS